MISTNIITKIENAVTNQNQNFVEIKELLADFINTECDSIEACHELLNAISDNARVFFAEAIESYIDPAKRDIARTALSLFRTITRRCQANHNIFTTNQFTLISQSRFARDKLFEFYHANPTWLPMHFNIEANAAALIGAPDPPFF